MRESAFDLSVVVVTYNSADHIGACLTSVETAVEAAGFSAQLIVVDNGSQDDSCGRVAEAHPAATLLRQDQNQGFAAGVNIGVASAQGKLLLLLNPDARVREGDLELLARLLTDDVSIGVVAPRVEHPSDRLRALPAGRQPLLWPMFTHYSGLSRFSQGIPRLEGVYLLAGLHDDARRDVEWASGAALLMRLATFQTLGGLNERWFMYAEDMDFCRKVSASGLRIVHEPAARLVHHIGASSPDRDHVSTKWVEATVDYYYSTWSPSLITRWTWKLVFAGGLISRALGYSWRARRDQPRRAMWLDEARKFRAYAAEALS